MILKSCYVIKFNANDTNAVALKDDLSWDHV